MKLSTIQKRGNLNEVFRAGEVGPGGAHHAYDIAKIGGGLLTRLQFQKGPRDVEGSTNGILMSDLLEITRDQLKSYQEGPYSTHENQMALNHIEEALMWLNRRAEDRIERNVLGTYNK